MKLKLYEQGGGLIYTPFIPEDWTTADARSSKGTRNNDEDAKLDPLDKEILGLMKDQNLIPSDIQMIYNRLIAFQRSTQSLSDAVGFGGTDSYRSAMPGMLQIMNLVSQAKYNKAMDDEIVKQMMKENAGNELAIDGYGRMWVQDTEGKIKKIKPESFDKEKHIALSNSQLLYFRERNPELAFDGQVFDDMRNMVGMSTVSKEIERIIKAFGTEEGQKYLSKEAAQALLDMNSPEGLYKLTQKGPSKGLREAWDAIWDQLPKNMQSLLNARAMVSGIGPKEFLADIVLRNTNRTVDIDYDSSASKAAGFDTDPAKTSADQLTQNNFLQMVGNLRGKRTIVSIAPRAAKINERAAITADAYTWGRVIDRDKKPIDTQSMASALRNGWGFAAGDPQTVIFGNKLLDNWELSAIMFDEQSNFSAVMLPYTIEKGHYVPDFELLEKFNKLQEIIDENPNISKTELLSKIENLDLNINDVYNPETNTFELQNTMAFLTVSGIASDDVLTLSDYNKKYLEKMDKEAGKHQKEYYNNMVKYGKLHPEKNAVEIGNFSDAKSGSFWKGNIFIPMQDAFYSMALSGIGEYVPKSVQTQFVERTAARAIEAENQHRARRANPNWANIGQF